MNPAVAVDYTSLGFFAAGMAIQALFMLWGKFERGDWTKLGIALFTGFLGMIPGRREHNYDVRLHLALALVFFSFSFSAQFASRLVSRVGARTLIGLNLLLLYLVLPLIGMNWYLLAPLLVATAFTFLNGFIDMDKHFGWQVFFYAWYATMVTGIGALFFGFGNLFGILGYGSEPMTIGMYGAFLLGSSFLYIISSAFFVINLSPIPLKKHQSFVSRMQEVRSHMQLLASGYVWQQGDRLGNALALVVVAGICYANFTYGYISQDLFVPLALTLIPFVMRIGQPLDDGIGSRDGKIA